MLRKRFVLFFVAFLVSSCAAPTPDPGVVSEMVENTLASIPSQTPYPTYTVFPTFTPLPTYTPVNTQTPNVVVETVVVVATDTPTPLYTPTITNTSTSTPTLTSTPDPLKAPRGNGFYLVGSEIAPGVWDSDGTGDGCYWKVTNAEGKILDNHYGLAGGTAYVPSTAFQVLFEDCGTWTWLQP